MAVVFAKEGSHVAAVGIDLTLTERNHAPKEPLQ
jgi:hypothetical protein